MATYNAVNAAKAADPKAENIVDPGGALHGNMHCWTDTYVGTGAEAAAQTIAFGQVLPVGAKIIDVILCTNAMGGTVDVGDAGDADRYQGTSADNAITLLDERGGFSYNITGTNDTQILVTLSAAVTLAGTIKVICVYTAD